MFQPPISKNLLFFSISFAYISSPTWCLSLNRKQPSLACLRWLPVLVETLPHLPAWKTSTKSCLGFHRRSSCLPSIPHLQRAFTVRTQTPGVLSLQTSSPTLPRKYLRDISSTISHSWLAVIWMCHWTCKALYTAYVLKLFFILFWIW